jgi:hypothetical protein
MRTQISWLLASLVALACGTAALADDPPAKSAAPRPPEEKKTAPASSGRALTPETLPEFLENMGYEPKVLESKSCELKIETGTWTVYVTVGVSPNQQHVWLSASFPVVPDPAKIPASVLRRMLEENDSIGPAHFVFNKSQKRFYIYRAIDNHGVTPARFRSELAKFSGLIPQTSQLWDPKKWPTGSDGVASEKNP